MIESTRGGCAVDPTCPFDNIKIYRSGKVTYFDTRKSDAPKSRLIAGAQVKALEQELDQLGFFALRSDGPNRLPLSQKVCYTSVRRDCALLTREQMGMPHVAEICRKQGYVESGIGSIGCTNFNDYKITYRRGTAAHDVRPYFLADEQIAEKVLLVQTRFGHLALRGK